MEYAPVDRLGSNDAGRPAGSNLRIEEIINPMYGPVVKHVFSDVQLESYRHSALHVNLVSVVDCSVLNLVEERELRRMARENRLFGRIAQPGCVLMYLSNCSKCRMSD